MWNSEWEYTHQELLKEWYQMKISGQEPDLAVRKIYCKGCGREFYTQIQTKKYCDYSLCGNIGYRKELRERRLKNLQSHICKVCGKGYTPKRVDSVYCSNACRQRAYRDRVTDTVSG